MLKIGSLFSGVGGLEMGVQAVTGGEVAWHAEIDPGACKVLAHRYPGVPNLGDITKVDWTAVPPANVLCAGFPCQDVSVAGARAGLLRGGNRSGLWGETARAIETMRPELVVLENVRGLLSAPADSDVEPCPWCMGDRGGEPHLRALGAVLADLADIGYDAWWIGLPASDVGAAHRRFRVFIFAVPADTQGDTWRPLNRDHGAPTDTDDYGSSGRVRGRHAPQEPTTPVSAVADASHVGHERGRTARDRWPGPANSSDAPADASGDGRDEGRTEPTGLQGRPDTPQRGHAPTDPDSLDVRQQPISVTGRGRTSVAARCDAAAADTIGSGRDRRAREPERGTLERVPVAGDSPTDWGEYGPAIERWETVIGRPAPPPTELGPKGGHRLAARFTEWLMGWPEGWVTDTPGIIRNEALKCCGNGVVPQQAAEAFVRWLYVVGVRA